MCRFAITCASETPIAKKLTEQICKHTLSTSLFLLSLCVLLLLLFFVSFERKCFALKKVYGIKNLIAHQMLCRKKINSRMNIVGQDVRKYLWEEKSMQITSVVCHKNRHLSVYIL